MPCAFTTTFPGGSPLEFHNHSSSERNRARCSSCGRISVERLGDVVWGCGCSKTTRQQREACWKNLDSYVAPEWVG